MKIKVGRTGLVVMMVLSAGFVILMFAGAHKTESAVKITDNEVITVSSWAVPQEVSFAGEPIPLTNFDTRESLDREVNATAYRHASTLLTIKTGCQIFS